MLGGYAFENSDKYIEEIESNNAWLTGGTPAGCSGWIL